MDQAWPGHPASETGCFQDAQTLRDAANKLEALISQLEQLRRNATQADTVLAPALVGYTADAVDAKFVESLNSLHTAVADHRKTADMLDATGTALLAAKWSMIVGAGIALSMLVWALANTDFTLGASLSEVPIARMFAANSFREAWEILVKRVEAAFAEALVRTVGKEAIEKGASAVVGKLAMKVLVKDVAVSLGIVTIQQLAVQAFLELEHHPESDPFGKQFLKAALSMALMGLVGGVTGHALGPIFTGVAGDVGWTRFVAGGLTGLSSAEASNVVGAAAGGGGVRLGTFAGGLIGIAHGVPQLEGEHRIVNLFKGLGGKLFGGGDAKIAEPAAPEARPPAEQQQPGTAGGGASNGDGHPASATESGGAPLGNGSEPRGEATPTGADNGQRPPGVAAKPAESEAPRAAKQTNPSAPQLTGPDRLGPAKSAGLVGGDDPEAPNAARAAPAEPAAAANAKPAGTPAAGGVADSAVPPAHSEDAAGQFEAGAGQGDGHAAASQARSSAGDPLENGAGGPPENGDSPVPQNAIDPQPNIPAELEPDRT
jgi:hypothetical protein